VEKETNVLEQFAGDLYRDDGAVDEVALDQFAKLGALALTLLTQQVAGAQVSEANALIPTCLNCKGSK
jgi:hypothetical protein